VKALKVLQKAFKGFLKALKRFHVRNLLGMFQDPGGTFGGKFGGVGGEAWESNKEHELKGIDIHFESIDPC